jgi:hypothetical protein
MKRTILFVLCILSALFFSGCVVVRFSDASAVSGKGVPEKYEINIDGFNKIRVEGFCVIQYYTEHSNTVILEIQPNLREYFVVEVQYGELIVRSTRKIRQRKSLIPVLTVSTPVLNSLTIEGMCTFNANDKITATAFTFNLSGAGNGKAEFDVNSLKASMAGAGDFEFSGRADVAEINLVGAGKLNAFSLQTREASVDLSGTSTIKINSSEKLTINANGAGTVEYRGSPSLSLNKSGLVSIRQAN